MTLEKEKDHRWDKEESVDSELAASEKVEKVEKAKEAEADGLKKNEDEKQE